MNANDVPRFWYRGTVTRVLDGDTFGCQLDLGLLVSVQATIRVLFANAPEVHSDTKPLGAISEAWLTQRLMGQPVWIRTERDTRSFVRWLGEVFYAPDEEGNLRNLAEEMIAAGMAVRTDRYGRPVTAGRPQ